MATRPLQRDLDKYKSDTETHLNPIHQIAMNQLARKLRDTNLADTIERSSLQLVAIKAEGDEISTRSAEPEKRAREKCEADDEVRLEVEQEQSASKKRRTQIAPQYQSNDVQLPFRAYSRAQTPSLTSPSYTVPEANYAIPKLPSRTNPSSATRAPLRFKPSPSTTSRTPTSGNNNFDRRLYSKIRCVHAHLPPEFFAFCAALGKMNISPQSMVAADDLADTFEAFYYERGIPFDPHLESREVCIRAEADLLDPEWLQKYIRNSVPTNLPRSLGYAGGRRMERPVHGARMVVDQLGRLRVSEVR